MNPKQYTLWHRSGAVLALVVSAVTYLLTIEPTASYWDCGEFIASSYKFEVGHPPGNPAYQLFARIASMFGDNMHAAMLINSLSAICSALTIFFLYLAIAWFLRRIIKPQADGSYTTSQAIMLVGSSLVGSLVYCFSDTFWFSAVEAEVYAMSSLFSAMVFWAMTMWYDRAGSPHAGRWIVLIAFMIGVSIGVHLLNLLMLPALVFMYFYRMREDGRYTFWQLLGMLALGAVLVALILFVIVPLLPKIAAYTDLLFVNVFGLPYNSGAAVFMLLLLAACFAGLFIMQKRRMALGSTVLLCFTSIVIGFSIFSIDVIRASAKTPTNEYQPDNCFTLVRYLSREQYGSNPLIYGEYYGAPYDLKTETYWAPVDGKYKKVDKPVQPVYRSEGKMLFPRMWSTSPDGRYEEFYSVYTEGDGKRVPGAQYPKPTMRANLRYFFDYQMNWMYWRYFMWNFVGRQNQIQGATPGDIFHGNWESGVRFIDNFRLGDQSGAPSTLADDPGKNHYFFLPLLLGLLGLFFQFDKDKRGCWLNFLLFFMTGIAIVIYLNQPPYQVRERDYAYAGSFYFFSLWCGLGVAGLWSLVNKALRKRAQVASAAAVSALCLFVPVQMAAQNWDDHDRSNRRTAVEMAINYLNSVGPNGILVTHGDNDTFPLWYAQEVEGVRTDVRIANTSLLGTDWHIDQMKWAVNESAPLPISVPYEQYLYGTNEYVPILDIREEVMSIDDVMTLYKHPQVKAPLTNGERVDYIASRKISVPVNKENVLKSGILDAKFADQIPDSIVLNISQEKEFLSKPEIFMLDLLAGYEWDRPINLLSLGGDLNMGIKEYMMFDGYSYRLVPIKSKTTLSTPGFVDTDDLYRKMTEVYKFDALAADDYFIDYQNHYTHLGTMSIRKLFVVCAEVFQREGQNDRAVEMLDMGQEIMKHYPIESIPLGFSGNDFAVLQTINMYYELGEGDKARRLAMEMAEDLLQGAAFYIDFYDYGLSEFDATGNYMLVLVDIMESAGDRDLAKNLSDRLMSLVDAANGE